MVLYVGIAWIAVVFVLTIGCVLMVFGEQEPFRVLLEWVVDASVLAAIAAFLSFWAALKAARAAEQSAAAGKAAAEASWTAVQMQQLPSKKQVHEAVLVVWRMLTDKYCVLAYSSKGPAFLITPEEIAQLTARREAYLYDSKVFGIELHKRVRDFYLQAKDQLEGQMTANDIGTEGASLSEETQKLYRGRRKELTDVAFQLLKDMEGQFEIGRNL